MKTANLAIVFTDIKGFTERTSRQTLEENQRLLQVHEALLAPLFRAFGGRIIKSIGDAFLVTFESPTQAVLSGIAIQDRLWHHNRALLEQDQIHVRVAVNVGEVRVENNDIFGEPVNIAARVEGITDAGEVFFTEAVYLSMNKAEVPSQEVGAFELKGIPGKIRVFRVPRAPYRVEAPSPDAVVSPVDESAMPPFGNLALSRVADPGLDLGALGQRAAVGAVAVGQRAAMGAVAVGQRATVLGKQARSATDALWSRMYARLPPAITSKLSSTVAGWAVSAALVLVLVGVWLLAAGDGATLRAIRAVEGTSGAEKSTRVGEARRLIKDEKDPAQRLYLSGRLEEAQGNWGGAMSFYSQALRKDVSNGDSTSRLISLLKHEQCGVRSSAAEVVASLRLEAARRALESLADDGGPNDGSSSGILGLSTCDSKKAATSALKRLAAN
ncbi:MULTISPECIES: adenylate/guanylate cyclase domain-containing protein [Corallococcus]|uniref:adenylate/guanylate cyclase domain-containing protein n=1 Tax=Corallococcus TaxID=83461 RepID=UPI00117D6AF3|nr:MULTISPECIES: adenylate/guanylate cyclase domain-containing protein [Corallococcus]NBD12042.1 adenylate/guanylate cyclase domain-containing protein [Corallococcus silvisoli]TSC26041.1 adenylate/guanylate cyclase domain-containing protein [Corallococcus sp. Z5C101001]